jgi:L-ascorbate metabolism protein UlaG (beta-lactamase superfamily)
MPGRDVRLELTWLGHSTTVIGLDQARVLTDPILRRHNPPLRRRGPAPAPSAWADVTAVVLSHLHHDHADLPSLRRLAGVPVYSAPANAAWLRRRGVEGVGLEPGEWVPLGDQGRAEVSLVPAVHGSRPMPHRPNAANGYLVRSASGTVWFAGDTSLYDGIADLPRLAGTPIDLALVPVGGWGARLSNGHMGPREAAQACAMTRARAAVPVHWGTLYAPWLPDLPRGWMDKPGPLFEAALHEWAPDCAFLRTAPGGTVRVPAGSSGADSPRAGGPR